MLKFDNIHTKIVIAVANGYNTQDKILKKLHEIDNYKKWSIKNRIFALKKSNFLKSTTTRIKNINYTRYDLNLNTFFNYVWYNFLENCSNDHILTKFPNFKYTYHEDKIGLNEINKYIQESDIKRNIDFKTFLEKFVIRIGEDSTIIKRFLQNNPKEQRTYEIFRKSWNKNLEGENGFILLFFYNCYLYYCNKLN